MRWFVGSRFVACSYFEMAVSVSVALALSPSFARLTASMLLRLHPTLAPLAPGRYRIVLAPVASGARSAYAPFTIVK